MKNEIKNYLLNNMKVTIYVVNEVNLLDYSLDFLEVVDMDYLNEYLEGHTPSEILDKMFYGDFNPNDSYFKFNAYGNLESFNEWDLEEKYKMYIDEIIEALLKNMDHIEIYDDELKDLLIKYRFDIDEEDEEK